MAESVYQVNSIARCTAVFKVGTVLTDPTTVVFTVRDPSNPAVVTTPAVVHDSTGNYHVDVTPTIAGTWHYVYQGSGAVVAEGQSDFFVTPDYSIARVNNLATLTWDMALELRDTTFSTWDSREMARLLVWAAAGAWPHLSRELDPTTQTITLVASTYFYALPVGMLSVSRVDYVDSNSNELGPLRQGSWGTEGDPLGGTAKLHVAPGIVATGGSLRLQGYGRYDLTTNYPLDDYVPLILAMARVEALRRMVGNRAQTENYISTSPMQNITVNEIVIMLNEANQEVVRLRSRLRKWQRPTLARHG